MWEIAFDIYFINMFESVCSKQEFCLFVTDINAWKHRQLSRDQRKVFALACTRTRFRTMKSMKQQALYILRWNMNTLNKIIFKFIWWETVVNKKKNNSSNQEERLKSLCTFNYVKHSSVAGSYENNTCNGRFWRFFYQYFHSFVGVLNNLSCLCICDVNTR